MGQIEQELIGSKEYYDGSYVGKAERDLTMMVRLLVPENAQSMIQDKITNLADDARRWHGVRTMSQMLHHVAYDMKSDKGTVGYEALAAILRQLADVESILAKLTPDNGLGLLNDVSRWLALNIRECPITLEQWCAMSLDEKAEFTAKTETKRIRK